MGPRCPGRTCERPEPLTSARQGTRCSTCEGFSALGVSNTTTPIPIWAGPVGAGPVRWQWPLSLSMCRDSDCGPLGPDPRSRSPLEGTNPTEPVPQNPAALPLIHLMAQDGVSLCAHSHGALASSHSFPTAARRARKDDNHGKKGGLLGVTEGVPEPRGRAPAQVGSREGPRLTRQRRPEPRAGSGGT